METKANSIKSKKILTKTQKNNLRKKTKKQRRKISKNVPKNIKRKTKKSNEEIYDDAGFEKLVYLFFYTHLMFSWKKG